MSQIGGQPTPDPGSGPGGGIPPGDPPVVSSSVGQLVIIAGETNVGTIALDPLLRDRVADVGIDPNDIDRMRWPMGASRHASITVLLTKMQLDFLLGSLGDELTAFGVAMSTLVFDRMYLRPPRGIIPREGDVLYACDLVDERFFWQKQGMPLPNDAFNVHTDRKMKLIEIPPDSGNFEPFDSLYETTTNDGVPYSPREILHIIFDALSPFGNAEEFHDFPQFVELDDTDAVRDLVAGNYSLGELIDKIMRATGMVLMAYPFVGYNTAISSARYNVERVSEGVDAADDVLNEFVDRILGGTLRSAPFGQADNPPRPSEAPGIAHYIVGEGNLLRSEIPAQVDVHFPRASLTGNYGFNDEDGSEGGVQYVTDRFFGLGYTLQSLVDDPEIGMGVDIHNGQTVSVVASYWAVEDDQQVVINQTQLLDRGQRIAANYYARFTSGVGDLLFAGLISIVPWAGALLMEWSISERGLMTRLSGEIDDPLLGPPLRSDEPLSAAAILSTGAIRAFTRPDGGLLLDAPAFDGLRGYFPAYVTQVHLDDLTDPHYSARALSDDTIIVTNERPQMRLLNAPIVYLPASLGALCTIINFGGNFILWEVSQETPNLIGCPVEPLESGYDASFLGL